MRRTYKTARSCIYLNFLPCSQLFFQQRFYPKEEEMNEPDIMTIREVADYLRLTEKTTHRFALEGKISHPL
jgi:hypothetical protein